MSAAARRLERLERLTPPRPATGEACPACPPWAPHMEGEPFPNCPACGQPVADFITFKDREAAMAWLRASYAARRP